MFQERFCVASHGWQDGNVFVWDACGQSSPLHQFQALHSLSSFGFCNLLQLSLLDGRLVFGLFRLRSQSTSAELHWYLPALPGARSASERHRCPATSRLCGELSMNSFEPDLKLLVPAWPLVIVAPLPGISSTICILLKALIQLP